VYLSDVMHCGRWGARKIHIIVRWLGTGQVVKIAGQFVKFEWLKQDCRPVCQVRVVEVNFG